MKIKKVCFVATIYALLIYLIYCEDTDLDKTLYILDSSFPNNYEKRLNRAIKIPKIKTKSSIDIWKDWLIYRIIYKLKLPKIANDAEFYIQDHKYAAKVLVENKKYTLLEDSPQVCSRYFENYYGKQMIKSRKKWNYKILRKLYGPLFGYHFGSSDQCKSLLLTQQDNHPYLDGKEEIILPEINNKLWISFSEYKKQRLLEIFDVSQEDIALLTNKKYLLLTDPIWPDDAPYKEHSRIYHEIISKYPQDQIMIKTHPRDINYPYEKEFPNIPVFRKAIPMEIFKLLGIKFSTIITLFSTAISKFKDTAIDWYGTEISDYCFRRYGHITPPVKVNDLSISKKTDYKS